MEMVATDLMVVLKFTSDRTLLPW